MQSEVFKGRIPEKAGKLQHKEISHRERKTVKGIAGAKERKPITGDGQKSEGSRNVIRTICCTRVCKGKTVDS